MLPKVCNTRSKICHASLTAGHYMGPSLLRLDQTLTHSLLQHFTAGHYGHVSAASRPTLTHSLLQRTRQASWLEELMPYNREFADGGRKTNLGLGGLVHKVRINAQLFSFFMSRRSVVYALLSHPKESCERDLLLVV